MTGRSQPKGHIYFIFESREDTNRMEEGSKTGGPIVISSSIYLLSMGLL